MNRTFCFLLSLVFLFNSASCVHVKESETIEPKISKSDESKTKIKLIPNGEIEYLVYSEAKYPLENFFNGLMAGEFTSIITRIDIEYKPSNHSNDAFEKMLKHGLRPVYIKLKNSSEENMTFRQEMFNLCNSSDCKKSILKRNVPRVLSETNPNAYVANAWNLTIVTTLIVMAAVILTAATGGVGRSGSVPSFTGGGFGRSSNDTKVFNETEKTLFLKFNDILIGDTVIPPKSEISGLIFFYTLDQNSSDWDLSFTP